MKIEIQLGEDEVRQAIINFIKEREPEFSRNKEFKIQVYTGIGDDDYSADIEVVDET